MKRICYSVLIIIGLWLTTQSAFASTVTVSIAGPTGPYTPAIFNVNVGDTIVWEMDFTHHNLGILKSDNTPILDSGYSNHSTPGGTSITYVVTQAGDFGFGCSLHPQTMQGGFTATAGSSSVRYSSQQSLRMQPIMPNPSNAVAWIGYELETPALVKLRVFDASGKLVMTAIDAQMQPGPHMQMVDTKQLPSGSYQYVLQAGDAILRRTAIVVR